ncbi:H-NS family nucleoid-associated regulatory protein [Sphaerotilus mobilis]|uniref:DNA-binding protein H-NS n=1 Tax=Sphaerotilus mobilis TaxID=47994 RepID=A0A4V2EX82_9BURK|nr:H-NS histone family protein [Sphaerotilus mobilis]RZS58580.1 DNA-binding protein H-NS [Sphaerotilus mobilis]
MTKKTLAQIQSQIDKLQKEAEAIRAREVADVVGRIKEAIAHYGLTAGDLGLDGKVSRAPAKKSGAKAAKTEATPAPKGRRRAAVTNAVTAEKPAKAAKAGKAGKAAKPARPSVIKFADDQGHSWTGVGKRPNWFLAAIASGKTADDLRVPTAG